MDVSWDAILSNFLLFLLIFGLSATVNFENLKRQVNNKKAFAAGLSIQYVFMPLVGFLVVKSFTKNDNFTPAMGLVLLVVTSSPGGSLSNWWCSTFNAELALSVAFSAVSSIASIVLLPGNVFLYTFLVYRNRTFEADASDRLDTSANESQGQSDILQSLDFVTIFVTLGIALAAMGLGIAGGYYFDSPCFHSVAHRVGSVSGVILICFSLFLTSGSKGDDTAWYTQHWSLFVATTVPCCLCLVASHFLARSMQLTPPETVAITIECCYQNMGIALSVAITLFDDPVQRAQAVAVPLVYGIIDAGLVGLYCLYSWKAGWTKAPASENICVVVSKSYEFEREHHDNAPAVKDEAGAMEDPDTGNDTEDDSGKASPSFEISNTPEDDVEQGTTHEGNTPEQALDDHALDEVHTATARHCDLENTETNELEPPKSTDALAERDCSALELCGSWSAKDAASDIPSTR